MYTKIFKNYLHPFYESKIKGRKTFVYLKQLNKNQWLPSEKIEKIQWNELTKLLAHAYQNTEHYKASFKKLSLLPEDIKSYEDFKRLPIISREDVIEQKDAMFASNLKSELLYKSTGGSTGVPVQLALDKNSYEWRTAATQRGYQWAHCEAGQHTLFIWSVDVGKVSFFQGLKSDLYHRIHNRKMFNCFDFDDARMLECLHYINTKKPTGIVAYTSAIYNLAKFIHDKNLTVNNPCLKGIITGAERLFDYQRVMIEKVFNIKVTNTYGCREFMLIACECEKHEGLHLTTDNLFIEILKDGEPAAPGETGEVVITDLHNYGMPFIRYKNGDIATQSKEACSCGRGLPLIQSVEGRILDLITAYNGKQVSGVFFPHLMKEIKEIKKFQIIQKALDHIIVKAIPAFPSGISESSINFCVEEIAKVVGEEVNIEFMIVENIPLTLSGKYRVTISEVSPELENQL